MAPAKLIVKNSRGKLEPFEVDGVEWIDGSVQVRLLLTFPQFVLIAGSVGTGRFTV
jgi:hypothetical protein